MTENYADYDTKQGVNFAKEVDDMEALKAARMEEQFPDEVDTPLDTLAWKLSRCYTYVHSGIREGFIIKILRPALGLADEFLPYTCSWTLMVLVSLEIVSANYLLGLLEV